MTKNHTNDWLQNCCQDFTFKKMSFLNSSELNPLDYCGNFRPARLREPSTNFLVLWRKPYQNRKPRFLVRTVDNQNRGFFADKWIWFRHPTFVFIYGTKPMSWFRRGDWRCLQSLQRRLIYLFNTWAAMRMLWKCIVSASNHCEVDRQRSYTQDLFNAIIRLAGRGRHWINGTGVCSNSIESSTNTITGSLHWLDS